MNNLYFKSLDLNNGDIITHNKKTYIVCLTYNFGVVCINKNDYYETTLLMQKQEYRDYSWIKRVRKYITVNGNINN